LKFSFLKVSGVGGPKMALGILLSGGASKVYGDDD
jgi:Holliday junction resolvasome RuvABC DNA-binding subunit